MDVGEWSALTCVLFSNKYYLALSWEGFLTSAQEHEALSNIPPGFLMIRDSLPSKHFLHHPHTCSSFKF